jgi:hypothetical protein
MSDPNEHRVVGRLLHADGSERPVYEAKDGRMYIKAGDGSPIFGVWLPPAFQPLAPPGAGDDTGEAPGEQTLTVRRDCEPHRASFLKAGGIAGIVLSMTGILLCCFGGIPWGWSSAPSWLAILAVAEFLASVPLCGFVAVAAGADLALMRVGRMDPAGWRATEIARACGFAGAFVGTFYGLLGAGFWWAMR